MTNNIKNKLATLPRKPGVYEMLNSKGKIIYVGKTINLYKRVSNYFTNNKKDIKTYVLVNNIRDFNFIITKNEVEALILESNIIKEKKPKYNVILKDDKHYPYIKIILNQEFSRLEIVRFRKKDKAIYFGPYTSSFNLNRVIKFVESVFMLRTCSDKELKRRNKPCLNYQIKRCLAPCVNYISKEKYKSIIDNVILFLSGKNNILLKKMKIKMKEFAKKLDFEMALKIKNQIQSIEKILEKQQMDSKNFKNRDIIGFYSKEKIANVCIIFFRKGKVIGKENFVLNFKEKYNKNNIMIAFLEQYYSEYYIPNEINLSFTDLLKNNNDLEKLLSKKKKNKIKIVIPKKGEKKYLINLADKNAKENYYQLKKIKEKNKTSNNLQELKKYLNLSVIPKIIEGYDISHIQGTNTVASVVVFKNGIPDSSLYKKFNIETNNKIDDFKSIQEAFKIRFKAYLKGKEKFKYLPDLIIVDGGKGQLFSAKKILKQLNLKYIPIFSLAKKKELLFEENNKNPINIPKKSEGFYLIQKIRDEAHRFAINFHKQKRNILMIRSILDEIKGVGTKRKNYLLKYFGSINNIKKAKTIEISKIISNKIIAKKIKEFLNNE